MKTAWQDTGFECEYHYDKTHPAKVLGRIYPEENAPGWFQWVIYLPHSFKKYGDDVDIGGMICSAAKAKACVEALLLIYGVIESEHTVAQIITDALLEDLDIDYSL